MSFNPFEEQPPASNKPSRNRVILWVVVALAGLALIGHGVWGMVGG
ncbi:MAG: hypothetical protein FWG11_05770 [Promicromonosporaceae bacterium]|nr:hypothetical protein [Promicromonosporaceae bacterium]